jgi:hypothetical protein
LPTDQIFNWAGFLFLGEIMDECKYIRDGMTVKRVSGQWHPSIEFAFCWKNYKGDTRTTIRQWVYDVHADALTDLIDDLEFSLDNARRDLERITDIDDDR